MTKKTAQKRTIVRAPKLDAPRGNKGVGFNGKEKTTYFKGRMHIVVSQQRIDEAVKNNSGHCMVADAIRDALPEARRISVDVQTIRWSDPVRRMRYMALTPYKVQAYIINWDQGLKPLPFDFSLRKAQVAHMQGTSFEDGTERRRGRGSVTKKKITKRRQLHLTKNGQNHGSKKETQFRLVTLGGKLPPRMGLRRSFGIRAFKLGDGAAES